MKNKIHALSPIVLFVYNRPLHTEQTIQALKNNELAAKSELFIFSDAAKSEKDKESVDTVRQFIETIDGFKNVTIYKNQSNAGLANNIIKGVSKILHEYGKVIVLEDDLITSPYFLNYMNNALNLYEKQENIFSISGFNYPTEIFTLPSHYKYDVYLNYRSCSWGWATWKDSWAKTDWEMTDYKEFSQSNHDKKLFNRGGDDLFDKLKDAMNGLTNSWAIRWAYTHYKYNAYAAYPRYSYISNIGFDNSGTHCKKPLYPDNDLSIAVKDPFLPEYLQSDKEVIHRHSQIHKYSTSRKMKELTKYLILYRKWKPILSKP
jgi:hypothetical protein